MHCHVEATAQICPIRRLDVAHFGGFRPHDLLPETLPLCYWNVIISLTLKLSWKLLLNTCVTSSSTNKLRSSYTSSVLLRTRISILKCSNVFKASLSAFATAIYNPKPSSPLGYNNGVWNPRKAEFMTSKGSSPHGTACRWRWRCSASHKWENDCRHLTHWCHRLTFPTI